MSKFRGLRLIEEVECAAMDVFSEIGPGLSERAYHKALYAKLRNGGTTVVYEHALPVYTDGILVTTLRVDLFVEDSLMVELKAVANLTPTHRIQAQKYIREKGVSSILINFSRESGVGVQCERFGIPSVPYVTVDEFVSDPDIRLVEKQNIVLTLMDIRTVVHECDPHDHVVMFYDGTIHQYAIGMDGHMECHNVCGSDTFQLRDCNQSRLLFSNERVAGVPLRHFAWDLYLNHNFPFGNTGDRFYNDCRVGLQVSDVEERLHAIHEVLSYWPEEHYDWSCALHEKLVQKLQEKYKGPGPNIVHLHEHVGMCHACVCETPPPPKKTLKSLTLK